MVQDNISTTPANQQLSEKKSKMIVNDVQLCCVVVLTFYRNHGKIWLTVNDIFSFLDEHYIITKERVCQILETLNNEYLISRKVNNDSEYKDFVQYTWSIRSNEKGLFHFVSME